jgi:hypothetical protein
MKRNTLAAIALLAALGSYSASATTTVLTFEGLQDNEEVLNYYDGGLGSLGSSGPSYGVTFVQNAQALIDSDSGGSGNFANEPTPDTILYFLTGGAVTMNYAAGFDTGFSFFYASLDTAFVNVYDGLAGTGTLLATISLAATPVGGVGDPNGYYSTWVPVGVAFNGTAKSVDFGGAANYVGFDNITFGSETPQGVPDAGASATLLGMGLLGLAGFSRRFSK